jgi:two-component system NtrC family response regulator
VVLCSDDLLRPEDVQPDTATGHESVQWSEGVDVEQLMPPNTPLPDVLNAIEKKLVEKALERADNVQTRAAEALGITKSLLQYKMKKFGLHRR